MTSLALLCLLASQAAAFTSSGTTAAIGLTQAQPNAAKCAQNTNETIKDPKCWKNLVDLKLYDAVKNSANYSPNTTFEYCSCNKTTNTCDAFCCCDNDCSFVSKLPAFLTINLL